MKNLFICLLVGWLAGACQQASLLRTVAPYTPDYALNRFEKEILKLEEDKNKPKHAVLFYGSSSWRLWKNMQSDLAPLPIINHGFGGSTIPELTHYSDRMVVPYEPKLLVVYAGENDLTSKKYKSPEQLLDSYRTFTELIWKRLPSTKIVFVSMKLSPSRRQHWEAVKQGNALVKQFSKGKKMAYIDINPLLFNPDGQVKGEFYKADSLHLNEQGYRAYAQVLRPKLSTYFKR